MRRSNRAPLRFFIYAVELVLLWTLQSTPGLLPELFGSKPMLLMALALVIAAKEDKLPSLVFGAVCGLITDISAMGGVGLFAIGLTLICYGECHILSTYYRSNIVTVSLCAAVAVPLLIGAYFLINAVFAGVPDLGVLFVSHYVSRMVYTFACIYPLYALNSLVYRRLR